MARNLPPSTGVECEPVYKLRSWIPLWLVNVVSVVIMSISIASLILPTILVVREVIRFIRG